MKVQVEITEEDIDEIIRLRLIEDYTRGYPWDDEYDAEVLKKSAWEIIRWYSTDPQWDEFASKYGEE